MAGAKWHYKTFDNAKVNVIFNNGDGGSTNQTEDITNISTSSFFTYSGTDYTNYKNVTTTVKPYIGYEIPELVEPIEGHMYCYLETSEWTVPSIYTWDASGHQWSGTWPGTKMTQVGISSITGNKIWRWDGGPIPETGMPEYMVFDDSKATNAEQTEDLDFVNGGYYSLYGMIGVVGDSHTTIRGDLDGNGLVDVEDVNIIINIILKINNDPAAKALADLDGNGLVDVEDVNMMINIILKLN